MKRKLRTWDSHIPLSQRSYRKDPWQDLLQRLAHYFLGFILIGTIWMTTDYAWDVYQDEQTWWGFASFPLFFFGSFIFALLSGFPFLFGIGIARMGVGEVGLFPWFSRILGGLCAACYYGGIKLELFPTIWPFLALPFLGGMIGAWFARKKSLPGTPI